MEIANRAATIPSAVPLHIAAVRQRDGMRGSPIVTAAVCVVGDDERKAIHAFDNSVEQKEHKMLLVIGANAIIHPRAVMIHSNDAPVAYST